jgi:hypothetical protein
MSLELQVQLPNLQNRAVYIYFKYLWNRNHRYQYNTAQIVTGDGGSGKTYFAILSAWVVNSKRFNENFYVNSAKEFITAVDDSRSGDTIVWDEVGVSLSSRKWHSLSNILTSETLQTYRKNKLTVFFVVPDMSFIDIQARKLMTNYVEMKRYGTNEAIAWIYKINIDRKKGEIYFPAYRMVMDGILMKMPRMVIPGRVMKRVPLEIWKAIHEKETTFKNKIRKQNLKVVSMIEEREGGGDKTIFDYINEIKLNRETYTNDKGELDWKLIKIDKEISRDKAQEIVTFLKKNRENNS